MARDAFRDGPAQVAHHRHRDEGHSTCPGGLAYLQLARLIHSPPSSLLAAVITASSSPASWLAQGRLRSLRSLRRAVRHHHAVDRSTAGATALAKPMTRTRALTRSPRSESRAFRRSSPVLAPSSSTVIEARTRFGTSRSCGGSRGNGLNQPRSIPMAGRFPVARSMGPRSRRREPGSWWLGIPTPRASHA